MFLWGFDSVYLGFCVFVGSGLGLSVSPAMAIGSTQGQVIKKKKKKN